MRDAQAARQQGERELAAARAPGSARCPRTTRGSPARRAAGSRPRAGARPRTRRARSRDRRGRDRSAAASAIASSIASLVPEPIEKCAVCAASPRSTTLPWCQRSQRTVGKLRQIERFLISRCPASSSAKSRSQNATVSSSVGSVEARRAPGLLAASTMNVERPRLVAVRVHAEQAVLALLEVERERRERPRGAEPHEAVRPHVDRRLEVLARRSRTTELTPSHATTRSASRTSSSLDLALEAQPRRRASRRASAGCSSSARREARRSRGRSSAAPRPGRGSRCRPSGRTAP